MGKTDNFFSKLRPYFKAYTAIISEFLNYYKTHFYKHRYLYLVLLSVSALYIFPLIFVDLPVGHDIYFHMTRIDGLAEELKLGHFPARIYSTTYYDYGYAAPLFYGDWLMYFPAFLVVLGTSVVTAYKTFIMTCAVLAALSMYFSAQVVFKNKKIACFTAVIYCLSTYLATDAFIRHANGEMQSFIFIPIAFAGLYDIIFNESRKWILLPLGLCGVLVTHTLTAVMTAAFLALFAVFFIVDFIQKPKKIFYIVASVGVFLLISSSFLLPMIEQLSSTKFLATDGYSANQYGSLETRSMQTIYSLFSVNNVKVTVDGIKYFIPQGVGLALPVMIGWRILYYKKTNSTECSVFLLFAVLALFMTSKYFPWESFQEELGTLQFPWRIFLFATFFITMFGGSLAKMLDNTNVLSIFISVIIVISFYSVTSTIYGQYDYSYKVAAGEVDSYDYDYENNIGLGEYLPTGTNKAYLRYDNKIETNGIINDYTINREDGVLSVKFKNAVKFTEADENYKDDLYIEVPLIMYKGYKATLETAEGSVELPVTYGKNNIIRVYIGDTSEGTLMVWYNGTTVQKVSFAITLISFCGIIVTYFIIKKRRKKEAENASLLDLSEIQV